MPAGVVKWFDKRKGWGFITPESGEEVFVHFSQIVSEGFRSLSQGDHVSFDIGRTERGTQAENVVKLEDVWPGHHRVNRSRRPGEPGRQRG